MLGHSRTSPHNRSGLGISGCHSVIPFLVGCAGFSCGAWQDSVVLQEEGMVPAALVYLSWDEVRYKPCSLRHTCSQPSPSHPLKPPRLSCCSAVRPHAILRALPST